MTHYLCHVQDGRYSGRKGPRMVEGVDPEDAATRFASQTVKIYLQRCERFAENQQSIPVVVQTGTAPPELFVVVLRCLVQVIGVTCQPSENSPVVSGRRHCGNCKHEELRPRESCAWCAVTLASGWEAKP